MAQTLETIATAGADTVIGNPEFSRRRFLLGVAGLSIAGLAAGCAAATKKIGRINDLVNRIPLIGYNLEHVAHDLYRSAQPDEKFLKWMKEEKNLGAVFILRGHNPEDRWYRHEIAVCNELGITLYVVELSDRYPAVAEEYIKLLEDFGAAGNKVKLIHCNYGANRSAFAVALYLLYIGKDVEDANAQLKLSRGFIKRDGYMPVLLEKCWNYIRRRESMAGESGSRESSDLPVSRADAMKEFFRSEEFNAILLTYKPDAKLVSARK